MLIRYESPVHVVTYEGGPYADVFIDGDCVDTINVWDYELGQAIPVEEREERIREYLEEQDEE